MQNKKYTVAFGFSSFKAQHVLLATSGPRATLADIVKDPQAEKICSTYGQARDAVESEKADREALADLSEEESNQLT